MQNNLNDEVVISKSTSKKSSRSITISLVVMLVCTILVVAVLLFSLNRNSNNSGQNQVDNSDSKKTNNEQKEGVYSIKLVAVNKEGYKNSLYLVNPSKQVNILISDKVIDANISPDNKFIAYIENTNSSTTLQIYDISTTEVTQFSEVLSNKIEEGELFSQVNWSPDGSYLSLSHGTYVIKTIEVIKYDTQDKSVSFSTSEFGDKVQYYWVDAKNIVYMHISSTEDMENKTAGSGMLTAISTIDVETGVIAKILTPEKGMEYSLINEPPVNGVVKVSKFTYNGSGGITKTEYFELNTVDGELTPVSFPQ